ncbi:MAG: excinuclease ABC subunit UvrA [Oligoflexia bacterium]|nr:excinuclease ABC subunit UvrA [Oligoflexia bacterium]
MSDSQPSIRLTGVKQNNLKNINVDFPIGKMTVVTGVSGSGKSSLAFDTLYAEGSRRYMESLSTYTRQFLEKMPRPLVDSIHNVPPAIALEQRNSINNNRTTVASMTEVYDYFRLLFAGLGRQSCSACGNPEVIFQSTESSVQRILALPEGSKIYLLASIPSLEEEVVESKKSKKKSKGKKSSLLGQELFRLGFQRLWYNGEIIDLSTAEGQIFSEVESAMLLIDRFVVNKSLKEDQSRIYDSLEQAFLNGEGKAQIRNTDGDLLLELGQGFSCTRCATLHSPPNPTLFSSNSPVGACEVCSGFGEVLELDEELIVPDQEKILRDGAVDPLSKPSYKDWEKEMLKALDRKGISTQLRYNQLNESQKKYLWNGEADFPGINGYFELLKPWKYKLHVRVFIRRYQSLRICSSCKGTRLSKIPLQFRIEEKNIGDVLELTINDALSWITSLYQKEKERKKVHEVLRQLKDRLEFLSRVGVGYITLNRKGNSLSGGEYQRISLASQLGSKLSNTLYILDEPSIGLHPSDTNRLIEVMHQLRDHGNTLVIVEHDSAIMKASDYLMEIGPQAGNHGGALVAFGNQKDFLSDKNSLTSKYLSGRWKIEIPKTRRKQTEAKIELKGCRTNNLKNVNLTIPLANLVAVSGVSGSGKSTLIHDTLYNTLAKLILREPIPSHEIGSYKSIKGWNKISNVLLLDQSPIGKSSRSNIATYMKIYDDIRKLMASQSASARKNLSASDFSFNVDGGRCPSCKGDGYIEVDMHFMADVRLVCDDCQGKRFKKHILDVRYQGKNIDDILHTTIDEAKILFSNYSNVVEKCHLLEEVGLGYLTLGQTVSSLSGGECQRLKIASTLDEQKNSKQGSTLYIFDEPTTGLHIHDIKKLIEIFHRLVNQGDTVLFIEHNIDLILQADWIIDMGPGGGSLGGQIVSEGPPEQVAKSKESQTALYLRELI